MRKNEIAYHLPANGSIRATEAGETITNDPDNWERYGKTIIWACIQTRLISVVVEDVC